MNTITHKNGNNLRIVNTLPDSVLQLVRDLVENKLTHDPARFKMVRVPAKRKPVQPVKQTPFGYFHRKNHDGRQFRHIINGQKLTVKTRNIYGKLIVQFEDGSMGTIGDLELDMVYMAI